LYTVTTDDQSQQQVDALPAEALAPFAEARATLEVAPWNGAPYHNNKPDSPMRALNFGRAGRHRVPDPGRSPPSRHSGSCLAGLTGQPCAGSVGPEEKGGRGELSASALESDPSEYDSDTQAITLHVSVVPAA
jgi:hypothetical protein